MMPKRRGAASIAAPRAGSTRAFGWVWRSDLGRSIEAEQRFGIRRAFAAIPNDSNGTRVVKHGPRRGHGGRAVARRPARRRAVTAADAGRARRPRRRTAASFGRRGMRDKPRGAGTRARNARRSRSLAELFFQESQGKRVGGREATAGRRVVASRVREGHRRQAHDERRQKQDGLDGAQKSHGPLRLHSIPYYRRRARQARAPSIARFGPRRRSDGAQVRDPVFQRSARANTSINSATLRR